MIGQIFPLLLHPIPVYLYKKKNTSTTFKLDLIVQTKVQVNFCLAHHASRGYFLAICKLIVV